MLHSNIYRTESGIEFYTPERCHITEIFNRHPNPEISVAQAKVAAGVTTANHLLRGTAEWYYILSGHGEMFLNGALAGQVSPGTLVHIPADTPQYIRNSGQEDLVFLCICMPRFQANVYAEIR
ncbi:MAG: cupin domain-containing protein [Thermoanaerobaculia bacterium]|nr:cupin domain-containing protein [Thermoanaerobaculia bacterium]